MPSRSSPRKSHAKFTLPDLPRDQWCDFRIKYTEQNRTLVQLAEEYMDCIHAYVKEHGPFYQDTYDAYLDKNLGTVDRDQLEC